MRIQIIRSVLAGSDSIEHLIGKTFNTHDETREFWEDNGVDIYHDGGIYPLLPEEYVSIIGNDHE